MAKENFLYLDMTECKSGQGLRGGALLVDSATEPLEFRCTEVVRPTTLQHILWGARLQGHIAAHLIGMPLLKSFRNEYSLLAIQKTEFLEVRSEIEVPVVLLSKDTAIEFKNPDKRTNAEWTRDMSEGREKEVVEEREGILSSSQGRFEPIILRSHQGYEQDVSMARKMLQAVFATRDVTEPFERILKALETLGEQGAGK